MIAVGHNLEKYSDLLLSICFIENMILKFFLRGFYPLCVCSQATQGSYLRGEKYRSLSRERKSSCGTVRSSSGSREQIHREFQQSNDRGRRSGSSRPSSQISRRSLSPAGNYFIYSVVCPLSLDLLFTN